MKTITVNIKYVLINRLTIPAASFLLLIVVGKRSGVLLGEYALVTTFYFIMQTLPLLGLTPFVMKEIARKPEMAGIYYSTIGALAIAGSLVVNLGVHLLLPLLTYPDNIKNALHVVGYTIIPGILAFLAEITLITLQQSKSVACLVVIENVIRVGCSITVLYAGGGIVELMWVLFYTRLSALFAYLWIMTRSIDIKRFYLINMAILKDVKVVLPVFLTNTILLLVLSRFDYIVLSLYASIEQIGYYAIAYRLLEISILCVTAILTAIYPYLSKKYVESRQNFLETARLVFKIFLIALVPVSLMGFFISDKYVQLLFRHQYPIPVQLTELFILVLIIAGIDQVMTSILNAADLQKYDLKALLLGSSLYAITLVMLVPVWNMYGALVALALAVFAQLSARLLYFKRYFDFKLILFKEFLGIVAASGGMAALILIYSSGNRILGLGLMFFGSILVYPVLLMNMDILHPGQILRFIWRNETVRGLATFKGMIDHVVSDIRRFEYVMGNRCRPENRVSLMNMSLLAVLIYRLEKYFQLTGHRFLSRFFWQLNIVVTKADIPPHSDIGPGLVLRNPVGVVISGRLGANVTVGPSSGVGQAGWRDVGAGPGMPFIGDEVTLGVRSSVLGGLDIKHGVTLPHHVYLHSNAQLNKISGKRAFEKSNR